MRKAFGFFIFCFTGLLSGQANDQNSYLDDKYREDQFYFSATYNLLANKPENVSQRGFSTGFHFGFIRDMPINKRRNWALGLGLGISTNSYNNNILISENNGGIEYTTIDEANVSFTKNKFTTYLLEVPFEIRWRNSDAASYKFWRVYTGIKLGYVVYGSSKFRGSLGKLDTSNGDFERLQYGFTLSFGYATFNFHLYYGLNNVFNSNAVLNEQSIDLSAIKIGLITYIL